MSRLSALVLLAASSFTVPVHAKPAPHPPKLLIGPVTWTTATILVEPTNAAPCRLQFKVGAHYVEASGPVTQQVVHLVGLAPDTLYEFRITCGQAVPRDATLRTLRVLGPVPAAPAPPKLAFVANGPATWTARATFTPPAGISTACWWEVQEKFDSFPATIVEADCSQSTSATYPSALSHGYSVTFGMRTAGGVTSSHAWVP